MKIVNDIGFQTKGVLAASRSKKCFGGQKPLGVKNGPWPFRCPECQFGIFSHKALNSPLDISFFYCFSPQNASSMRMSELLKEGLRIVLNEVANRELFVVNP